MTKKKTENSFIFDITKIANAELLKKHNKLLKTNETLLKENKQLKETINNNRKNYKENETVIGLAIDIFEIDVSLAPAVALIKELYKKIKSIEDKPLKEIIIIFEEMEQCFHQINFIDIKKLQKFEFMIDHIASKYA